jgi:hypothetical protein
VRLLRNNVPIAAERLTEPVTRLSLTDEDPLDGHCIRGAPVSAEPFAFCHLQVEAQDGRIAWPSPVWLTL